MCRVRVDDLAALAEKHKSALSQERPSAVVGTVIDMSNPGSALKFLGSTANSDFVVNNTGTMGIAHRHKEVLVAFRGFLPLELYERIDTDSGLGIGPLMQGAAAAQVCKLRGEDRHPPPSRKLFISQSPAKPNTKPTHSTSEATLPLQSLGCFFRSSFFHFIGGLGISPAASPAPSDSLVSSFRNLPGSR